MAETPRTVAQDRYVTHSRACWQWHPACARERLLEVEQLLMAAVADPADPTGQGARALARDILHLIGVEEEFWHAS